MWSHHANIRCYFSFVLGYYSRKLADWNHSQSTSTWSFVFLSNWKQKFNGAVYSHSDLSFCFQWHAVLARTCNTAGFTHLPPVAFRALQHHNSPGRVTALFPVTSTLLLEKGIEKNALRKLIFFPFTCCLNIMSLCQIRKIYEPKNCQMSFHEDVAS